MKIRLLGMIFGVLLFTIPALGQVQNIAGPPNASKSEALQQHMDQQPLYRQLMESMAEKPLLIEPDLETFGSSRWDVKSAAELPVTHFKPAKGTILPHQLAEMERNLDSRKKAVKYYEDLIDLYQSVAHKDGFPANSVAYAFNYYVVNNYHVFHDLLSNKVRVSSITPIGGAPAKGRTVTLKQEQNLFRQFEVLLGEDPSIRQMSDKEKQSVTESLAIMTNECFKLYQYALENDDKRVLRTAQDTALDNLINLLGERAIRLRITDRGMEF